MTTIKESGNLYFCHSYFHSSLQNHHPKYQENHMQKVSHHVLQQRLIIRRPMITDD